MKMRFMLAAVAGFALSVATTQATILLDFSSVVGAKVAFNGGTFSMTPSTGTQFTITSSTGGVGDATSLGGRIDAPAGGWTIGTVTPFGPGQYAPVTGSGTITISDGTQDLVANLTWIDIQSLGTSGGGNVFGSINLTSIAYSGVNADLNLLMNQANANGGVATLAYTFSPGLSLTQLKSGSHETGFTGTLSVAPVPEPSTVVAGALLLLPFGASAFRSMRKNRKV